MQGLSYHRCGLADPARRAYEQAGDHAAALSNLGELAWRAGRPADAAQRWTAALARDGKLFAAHLGLAIAGYEQLHARAAKDPQRRSLAADAELHAASALALADDPLPLAVLALIALDGFVRPAPALARAYVDDGLVRDDKHAQLLAVRAVLGAGRGEWTLAALAAERAVQLAPHDEAVQRLAGLVEVRFGRYDAAASHLAAVAAPAYDVLVARAVAARGRGDANAVALYEQAIQLDPSRAEAHYDLGLYYELYASPPDPQRARDENAKAAAIDAALRR
jgi:hypothetical protein